MGWFGRAYTSTYVLDEAMTLTKARIGGAAAVELERRITASERITILKVEERDDILGDAIEKSAKFSDVKKSKLHGLYNADSPRTKFNPYQCLLSFERNFKALVPMLVGEEYYRMLSRDDRQVLLNTAKRLGIIL